MSAKTKDNAEDFFEALGHTFGKALQAKLAARKTGERKSLAEIDQELALELENLMVGATNEGTA